MITCGITYRHENVKILSRASGAPEKKIKEHTRVVKMDKKRLKVALVVLGAVESRFPETKEFIDDTLKEECEKEKIAADEVIFLQV